MTIPQHQAAADALVMDDWENLCLELRTLNTGDEYESVDELMSRAADVIEALAASRVPVASFIPITDADVDKACSFFPDFEVAIGDPMRTALEAFARSRAQTASPVAEWEKLLDPDVLHANLLRGVPAKLTKAHLLHLMGTGAAEPVTEAEVASATKSYNVYDDGEQPMAMHAALTQLLQSRASARRVGLAPTVTDEQVDAHIRQHNLLRTDENRATVRKELLAKISSFPREYHNDTPEAAAARVVYGVDPVPHLFEFWWAEYMPKATQSEAWAAWVAAPQVRGVGVEAPPSPAPVAVVGIKDKAALESACRFIEKKILPRKCDSDGISGCWRCQSIYLAVRMRELIAAQPTKEQS